MRDLDELKKLQLNFEKEKISEMEKIKLEQVKLSTLERELKQKIRQN